MDGFGRLLNVLGPNDPNKFQKGTLFFPLTHSLSRATVSGKLTTFFRDTQKADISSNIIDWLASDIRLFPSVFALAFLEAMVPKRFSGYNWF